MAASQTHRLFEYSSLKLFHTLKQSSEVRVIIMPISQIRKLRVREVK